MIDAADRCILVADDDPAIRHLLITYLGHRGFQMREARNGREALAAMRAGCADLVILDLMMPDVSGLDVLRERAAEPSLTRIPIIVVTAIIRRETTADFLDKHVWAVLGKPFDLASLLTAVITCLEEHPHVTHPIAA